MHARREYRNHFRHREFVKLGLEKSPVTILFALKNRPFHSPILFSLERVAVPLPFPSSIDRNASRSGRFISSGNQTFVPCKIEPTFVFALIQRSKERREKKENLRNSLKRGSERSYTSYVYRISAFLPFFLLFLLQEVDIENQSAYGEADLLDCAKKKEGMSGKVSREGIIMEVCNVRSKARSNANNVES